MTDPINNPAHYNQGEIECIDAIASCVGDFESFLAGQVIKYVWRYRHKGDPLQDLKKAEYYLQSLIARMPQ